MGESLARLLHEQQEEILARWERLARAASPRAAPLSTEEVVDDMPHILRALAARVEGGRRHLIESEQLPFTGEHAVHRRHRGFALSELVREYGLLRQVIAELADEGGGVDAEALRILHAGIDQAISDSARAFSREELNDLLVERQRFQLALGIGETVVFEQDRQLRYVWVRNPTFRNTESEFVGKTDADLFPDPAENGPILAAKQAVLEGGQRRVLEVPATISGERRWFQLAVEPRRNAIGELVGVIGAAVDITVRRKEEELLGKAHEFRKQILGVVSHDLRNPLAAIILGAQGLLRRGASEERVQRNATRILGAAERALRLIHDLLDYARAQQGQALPLKPVPAVLDDLAAQVVEEVSLAFPDREVRFRRQAEELAGRFDPDRIVQALTNLARNALEHARTATPVTMTVGRSGCTAWVAVHNQGDPIPEEVRARLFQPFSRGIHQGTGGNVGLGLFISNEIVRAHGGSIEVESSARSGTTFRIVLPLEDRV